MLKKYLVTLTPEERQQLEQLLAQGQAVARTLRHAQALLKADQAVGWTDADIADAFGLSVRTVERLRQRFVEEGFEAALVPKVVSRLPRKVDGDLEAHLVALACSDPPPGRRRWALRLPAGKLVELRLVGSISHEGVRRVLKKTRRSRGRRRAGASRRMAAGSSSARWRMCCGCTSCPTTRATRRCAWTKRVSSWSARWARRRRAGRGSRTATGRTTCGPASASCSCGTSRWPADGP